MELRTRDDFKREREVFCLTAVGSKEFFASWVFKCQLRLVRTWQEITQEGILNRIFISEFF
jgi:hypothetical protein